MRPRGILHRGLTLQSRGVTLIELIAFIAIAAIVAAVMVQTFSGTMRGSHLGKEMTQATQLAQQRMEVIMGQRKAMGYSTFIASPDYDPCQSGAWATQMCSTSSVPAGNYTVSSVRSAADACGTGCTDVAVMVDDPYGSRMAELTMQFWGY